METWVLVLFHAAARCGVHQPLDLLGEILSHVLHFLKTLCTSFFVRLPIAPSKPDMCSPQEVKKIEKTKQQETAPIQMRPMEEQHINAVEAILDYKFENRVFVAEALTHNSIYYPLEGGRSYYRLEFLGDAVLNYGVTLDVFCRYPNLQPGMLTRLRSANVDTEKLARIAVTHGLHRYLRHNIPKFESQIHDFVEDLQSYPIHSNGLVTTPKVLSNIVESLIGAILIDTKMNFEIAWKVFVRLSESFITIETLQKHPVTELQELCQNLHRKVKFNDKNWAQNHTIEVLVDGKVICSTSMTYNPKKEICQNRAATVALNRLKELLSNKQLELFLNADK